MKQFFAFSVGILCLLLCLLPPAPGIAATAAGGSAECVADTPKMLRLQRAGALLTQGDASALRKEFQQAISYFDQGLEDIGTSYYFNGLDDSTDLKLLVACDFQNKNDLESAANLKQKILTIRIEFFKQKHQCE